MPLYPRRPHSLLYGRCVYVQMDLKRFLGRKFSIFVWLYLSILHIDRLLLLLRSFLFLFVNRFLMSFNPSLVVVHPGVHELPYSSLVWKKKRGGNSCHIQWFWQKPFAPFRSCHRRLLSSSLKPIPRHLLVLPLVLFSPSGRTFFPLLFTPLYIYTIYYTYIFLIF